MTKIDFIRTAAIQIFAANPTYLAKDAVRDAAHLWEVIERIGEKDDEESETPEPEPTYQVAYIAQI